MSIPPAAADSPAQVGSPAGERQSQQRLTLRLDRPTSTSVIVHVAGELDATTAAQLRELLAPRLDSDVATIVLDLSGVDFMGVAGLEVVADARDRAGLRAMTLCVVDGPRCVERALRATAWGDTISRYHSVQAALAGLSGR